MVKVDFEALPEFYSEMKSMTCGRKSCSVLILVAHEVDAVACCRLLTQLLRSDSITYTIVPISDSTSFKDISITSDVKCIFMINCGATINISKTFLFEKGRELRFFVLDNHRPFHLANVYSRHNIVVFDKLKNTGDSDDGNDEHDDNDSLPSDGSLLSLDSDDSASDDDDDDDLSFESEFDEQNAAAVDIDEDSELKSQIESDEDDNGDEDDERSEEKDGDGDDAVEDEEANINDNRLSSMEGDNDDNTDVVNDTDKIPTTNTQSVIRDDSDDNLTAIDGGDGNSNGNDIDIYANSNRKKDTNIDNDNNNDDEIASSDMNNSSHNKSDNGGDNDNDNDDDEVASGDLNNSIHNKSDNGRGDNYNDNDEDEEEQIKPRKRQKVMSHLAMRRTKLKSYYYQNIPISTPTSVVFVKLACSRGGGLAPSVDILWQGALGIYDQYSRNNIKDDMYDHLNNMIKVLLINHNDSVASAGIRYVIHNNDNTITSNNNNNNNIDGVDNNNTNNNNNNNTAGDIITIVPTAETGNMSEGIDYRFFLMRHWSLYKSILHSPYILLKLTSWKSQGVSKIQELLAKVGIPLDQSNQSFLFMIPTLRNHFLQELVKESTKREFHLSDPDITYRSFFRHNSFKMPVSTSDVVLATSAYLEAFNSCDEEDDDSFDTGNTDSTDTTTNGTIMNSNSSSNTKNKNKSNANKAFNDAYDCLGTKSEEILNKGFEMAILIQMSIVKKVSAILDNYDALVRVQRMYFTYVYRLGHSTDMNNIILEGSNSNNNNNSSSNLSHDAVDLQSLFYRPKILLKIGELIMNIKMNLSRRDGGWSGSKLLPLFLLSEKKDSVIIVGISPLQYISATSQVYDTNQMEIIKRVSNFHLYFKLAAKEMKTNIKLNQGFHSNACEISRRDAHDFLGTLDYLFKKATSQRN